MITAADINTKRGQVLYEKGMVLDHGTISRLRFYGIDEIEIEGDADPGIDKSAFGSDTVFVDDILSAEEIEKAVAAVEKTYEEKPSLASKTIDVASPTGQKMHRSLSDPIPDGVTASPAHQQTVRSTPEFQTFQMNYAFAINETKALFKRVQAGESVTQDEIQSIINRLYDENNTTLDMFDKLHNVRSGDDPIYTHCLDVAIISRILGKWMKFSLSDQICLGICGMMHDVGKMQVPDSILNKPGRLTEEELGIMRKHTIYGFNMLKNLELDPRVKKAALMHHERSDGLGYPFHRTTPEVHPFSQIIAIADVYDATTAKRSYRSALCPFEVIDTFEKEGIARYNTQFLMTFLKNIAQTYQNNRVILSDGRTADIAILNQHRFSRPVVALQDGTFLDLAQYPDLTIQSVL